MNDIAPRDTYGVLEAPDTLRMERLLPGPIERVWAYLVESDLRRTWFAAGEIELRPGAPFELVWRNNELTDPPGQRPPGFSGQHRMDCRVLTVDPPRRLAIQFGPHGEVSFTLAPHGQDVMLTLVHSGIPNRDTLLKVSAGWHAHLDLLADRAGGAQPAPFWDHMAELSAEYARRFGG
jgi:uncharacterized protein YndB with AHSA1/START domain